MDRNLTIEQLESEVWAEPTYDSGLVRTVHELRRKPLAEFTVEDLRIMLGQQAGVPYLVPLALDVLEKEPFARGDFYPGDLLGVTLGTGPDYWRTHPDEAVRMARIAEIVASELETQETTEEIRRHLHDLLAARPWHAA